jgi:hypothetical protein
MVGLLGISFSLVSGESFAEANGLSSFLSRRFVCTVLNQVVTVPDTALEAPPPSTVAATADEERDEEDEYKPTDYQMDAADDTDEDQSPPVLAPGAAKRTKGRQSKKIDFGNLKDEEAADLYGLRRSVRCFLHTGKRKRFFFVNLCVFLHCPGSRCCSSQSMWSCGMQSRLLN